MAHVFDLRLGREDPEPAVLMEMIARSLPDQIALSGDLAQRARRAEAGAAVFGAAPTAGGARPNLVGAETADHVHCGPEQAIRRLAWAMDASGP